MQDKSTSDNERARIFGKIKAKLDEEVSKVQDIKQAMSEAQKNLTIDRKAEMDHWKAKMNEEEEERKRQFETQKVKDNHVRSINDALLRLKQEQQRRAKEVLRELSVRGIK